MVLWILDNKDEILNGETNKELASYLATRGVIIDVNSVLSVTGTMNYYTFPCVYLLIASDQLK